MGIDDGKMVLKPFDDLVKYVPKPWKARLDKRPECTLVGSKLCNFVLNMVNSRFVSNVEEANELFDRYEYVFPFGGDLSKMNGNVSAFQAKMIRMNDLLHTGFVTAR